jgi:hypothetical protein
VTLRRGRAGCCPTYDALRCSRFNSLSRPDSSPGGFTLAGVVLGPWLKARSDQEHWRRQVRLDAYAELHRAVIELAFVYDSEEAGAAESKLHDLVRAESRVRLVAPKAVREVSFNLARKLSRDIGRLELINTDEWTDEIRRLHEAFAEAARRDLCIEGGSQLRGARARLRNEAPAPARTAGRSRQPRGG